MTHTRLTWCCGLAVLAAIAHPTSRSLLAASPPVVVFDQASATGPVVRSANGPIEIVTIALTDSTGAAPRDTIPALALIEFRWHAEPSVSSPVVAYRYNFEEPPGFGNYVEVDSSVRSVTYNTRVGGDVVHVGPKIFRLQAINDLGKATEITRSFWVGYSPDSWFAGPDTTVLDPRFGWTGNDRSIAIADWEALPDLGGSLLSCDSLTQRPAERREMKTFFEIYRDQLYLRTEDDTVHMNSIVLVHGGGSDLDSPYSIVVAAEEPTLQDTSACLSSGTLDVVHPDSLDGSPVGHRIQQSWVYQPGWSAVTPAQSLLFPLFDTASPLRVPSIGGYVVMNRSARFYVVMRSQDGDGLQDRRIIRPVPIADSVDAGLGTPLQIELRRRILTLTANRAPYLLTTEPGFVPTPGQSFSSRTLSLNLLADDDDPYDPANPPPPGGPSATKVLRWKIRLLGTSGNGDSLSHEPFANPVDHPDVEVEVPLDFSGTNLIVEVELCDCADCALVPGSGRCVVTRIPILIPGHVVAGGPGPGRPALALEGLHPNPAVGRERIVRFSLATREPARLEMIDTAGRRWMTRDVGSLGPGSHALDLGREASLPPGIYLLRLTQGGITRVTRAAILE